MLNIVEIILITRLNYPVFLEDNLVDRRAIMDLYVSMSHGVCIVSSGLGAIRQLAGSVHKT
ncbi:MAG: hypothetical protein JWQ66_2279 [Mucilaginibacter sp.]|nr:hypothetical protein [Mucilaginibacter sp.]